MTRSHQTSLDPGPHVGSVSGSSRPGIAAATAVALATAVAAALVAAATFFGSADATWAAMDFNAAPFEDFLGPYWQTARHFEAGRMEPAPGYVYPSTLAWLLTPLIAMGAEGPIAASIVAALLVLGSLGVLLAAAFTLARPRSLVDAAAAGAALGLSHAALHGAYWAQASLPAIALTAAALALRVANRPGFAGAALGLAAALKVYPAIVAVAFLVPGRNPRALGAFAVTVAVAGGLAPLALMGADDFVAFHQTVSSGLAELSNWVFTEDAGSGSQDVPTVLLRVTGFSVPAVALRFVGGACGAILVAGAVRSLRRGGPRASLVAFVYLAAVPWAAVSPTWPHGLLWIPLGWWCAARSTSLIARALALASFAPGSVMALALAGSPAGYVASALPAWSALLCLLAVAASHESAQDPRASAYAARP